MKAIVGTFLPLCIFSFIAFGLSLIFLDHNNSDRTTITSETTIITESYTDIELTSNGINVRLFPSDRSDTVIYTNKDSLNEISVEINDGTLDIYCEKSIDSFEDLFINIGDTNYVDIAVPANIYNSIDANVNAGTTKILGIGAQHVELQLNAGDLTYSAPEDHVTPSLTAALSAGNCTLYNAQSETFDLQLSAGNMDVYGLSGNGNIEASAGSLTANFAQLDGDLNVEVSAGSIDINLPQDASFDVYCDKSAGDVTIKHGKVKESLSDDENKPINGGEYGITCNVSAGSINITDNVKIKKSPVTPVAKPVDTASAELYNSETAATPVATAPAGTAIVEADDVSVYVDENAELKLPSVKVDGDKVNVDLGAIKVDVN